MRWFGWFRRRPAASDLASPQVHCFMLVFIAYGQRQR
jgi:hypothetical protein